MIILKFRVREMVPSDYGEHLACPYGGVYIRACIPIQQSRRFDHLLAILASLALEGLVCLTQRTLVELEKLAKGVNRKVPLRIFLLIHYSR